MSNFTRTIFRAIREVVWRVSDAIFRFCGLYVVVVDCPGNGFFAQLSGLISLYKWCLRNERKPCIRLISKNYSEGGDFLRNFFEPIAYNRLQKCVLFLLPKRKCRNFHDAPNWNRFDIPKFGGECDAIVNKYFRLRSYIESAVGEYVKLNLIDETTLGVHYRGTDKFTESSELSKERCVAMIVGFLKGNRRYTSVYLASDCGKFIAYANEILSPLVRVILRDEDRSFSNTGIHFDDAKRGRHLGYDALLNCLILARCGVVLKTMSNLSGWSKVFNSELQIQLLNQPSGNGVSWLGFPEREMVELGWFYVQDGK